MKNRNRNIAATLLAAILMGGCGDFLEKEPVSDLTQDKFWKTPNDAEVGVLAIYNGFSKALGTGLWNWGEFRGDNFIPLDRGGDDQRELMNNTIQYDNQAAYWTNLYVTISRANDAIAHIPDITMTTETKNKLLAEAYTMRAWAYFYCVRVWGDVPVFLEPVTKDSPDNYRPRTDKTYILENIILPDLELAYSLMPKPGSSTEVDMSRANTGLICALLMDVHAWTHNYEAVIRVKEERLNLFASRWRLDPAVSSVNFATSWRAIFYEGTTSPEVLFKLTYAKLENGDHQGFNNFAGGVPRATVADRVCKTTEVFHEGNVDKRYVPGTQWLFNWSWYPDRTRFRYKFWPDDIYEPEPSSNIKPTEYSDNDLVLYRYADVTLLYAEALNQMDKTDDAVNELNRTRRRTGLPGYLPSDFTDKEQLTDAILNERQREFIGEGKRWFDLVRMNRWRQVMGPINGMDKEWMLLFPIHRDHLIQNSKITQNEGYQQ
ncbi:MAG: RagB/SusD family nutrient uptake outer membrane protein [Mediterranea sp.]|jgi:hypothetical protein|nr:RagB/SusD family nutrient uptake outer membrane protein [Mediterranea sp.]